MTTPAGNSNVTPINPNAAAWGTSSQQPSYSVAKFYTDASDRNGQSTKVSVNVPTNLYVAVMKIIGTREIPQYESFSDVVRDSFRHRFEWVKDNKGTPALQAFMATEVAEWDMENMIASAERKIATARDHLSRLEGLLSNCAELGLWATMRSMIQKANALTDGTWDGALASDMNRLLNEFNMRLPEEFRLRDI